MSETKTVWHPYPQEKPNVKDGKKSEEYLVTVKFKGKLSVVSTSFYFFCKMFYEEYFISDLDKFVTAWAELPEPYKEENDV